MRYISSQTKRDVRFVGLSTAVANAQDLADWLGIGSKVRMTQPLSRRLSSFSTSEPGRDRMSPASTSKELIHSAHAAWRTSTCLAEAQDL